MDTRDRYFDMAYLKEGPSGRTCVLKNHPLSDDRAYYPSDWENDPVTGKKKYRQLELFDSDADFTPNEDESESFTL